MTWAIPTINGIQRTNLMLVALAAAMLWLVDSGSAAVGCLLGGAVMVANLFILSMIGRLALAAAGGGAAAHRAGVLAIPLKLLLIVMLVYLVFTRANISALGFAVGVFDSDARDLY